jgi:predicted nucleotide-binding protein (sugar kinase/HSP70/actin superfamily)
MTAELYQFNSVITAEKVKFRIKEIRSKLDIEYKVKAGIENMLVALAKAPSGIDPKIRNELREKMNESNTKILVLTKAENRYRTLTFTENDESEDALFGEYFLAPYLCFLVN